MRTPLSYSTRQCARMQHIHFCFILILFIFYLFLFIFYFFSHFYFRASGQAVVTGVVPSPPRFLPSIFFAHRVQHSHCSSIFRRVLLTQTLSRALSASQFVHKKKYIYAHIQLSRTRRRAKSMQHARTKLKKMHFTLMYKSRVIPQWGCMHAAIIEVYLVFF